MRDNGDGTPGAARVDWSGRVARVQRQAEQEGLVLPAEQRSRHVSEQEARRRERAIRQWEREEEVRVAAGQGANAGGASAEGGAVAAASAALSPAQDVEDGQQHGAVQGLHDALNSTCDGQGGNVANVSADVGEHSEEDERGGMVQGSNGVEPCHNSPRTQVQRSRDTGPAVPGHRSRGPRTQVLRSDTSDMTMYM